MANVEPVSSAINIPNKNIYTHSAHMEEAESFTDAIKKLSKGRLKLSEKQTSIIGIIGIAFCANVMFFGEKFGLHKLGALSQAIGATALLAGTFGLLFCTETYGKKAERKLAKLFNIKEENRKMIAKQDNTNEEKAEIIKQKQETKVQKIASNTKPITHNTDICTENYEKLGLHLTHN